LKSKPKYIIHIKIFILFDIPNNPFKHYLFRFGHPLNHNPPNLRQNLRINSVLQLWLLLINKQQRLLSTVKLISPDLLACEFLPKLDANLENLLIRQFLKLHYVLESLSDRIDYLENLAMEVIQQMFDPLQMRGEKSSKEERCRLANRFELAQFTTVRLHQLFVFQVQVVVGRDYQSDFFYYVLEYH
jgi:hypothetical protein